MSEESKPVFTGITFFTSLQKLTILGATGL